MEIAGQSPKNIIYLAGFMGSGKSTIGPILANALGFDFVDIDKLIEERTGKQITEIFRQMGEKAFRALEHELLVEVSSKGGGVVALGGGAVGNQENLDLIRSTGIMVYLQLPPEEAVRRMRNKSDRPMLRDAEGNKLSETELRKKVEELLKRREPFYAQADLVIPTGGKRVGGTVDEIVRKLRRFITH